MRVCIVGASGVLGRALVSLLLQRNESVRALARFTREKQALFPPEVESVPFDLLSVDAARRLPSLLEGCDAVVHAATQIPSDFSAPGAWDLNTRLRTEGTRRLVGAAVDAGARVYIQQSITMAYPDMGDQWIDEEVPLDTTPARSRTSSPVIAMENTVRSIATPSLRWCIIRGGMFVGRGTFQEREISQMIARELVLPGNGQNFLSAVHVIDMADAIALALRDAPAASTFNITAEPVREGEYFDSLAAAVDAPRPALDPTKPNAPSWRCSNRKAKEQLGWVPRQSIYPTLK